MARQPEFQREEYHAILPEAIALSAGGEPGAGAGFRPRTPRRRDAFPKIEPRQESGAFGEGFGKRGAEWRCSACAAP